MTKKKILIRNEETTRYGKIVVTPANDIYQDLRELSAKFNGVAANEKHISDGVRIDRDYMDIIGEAQEKTWKRNYSRRNE
ncbi:MAG: hypothetical protein WC781_00385 [Candidatus Pacearchaeota archaeon]|jgi:hypothetical protein